MPELVQIIAIGASRGDPDSPGESCGRVFVQLEVNGFPTMMSPAPAPIDAGPVDLSLARQLGGLCAALETLASADENVDLSDLMCARTDNEQTQLVDRTGLWLGNQGKAPSV